jgi:hypothetical protein
MKVEWAKVFASIPLTFSCDWDRCFRRFEK